MSGDVQPRKRKDKKKKKDDLGIEEPRGTAAVFGEGDVLMHSYHEHGTGGHWCAKIIFFSLLAVLITLIGLIILENRGLTELEANQVESRYSGVLEGWLEDAPDDDHHDEHTLELKHHGDEDDNGNEFEHDDDEDHHDDDDEDHHDDDDEDHHDDDDEDHHDDDDEDHRDDEDEEDHHDEEEDEHNDDEDEDHDDDDDDNEDEDAQQVDEADEDEDQENYDQSNDVIHNEDDDEQEHDDDDEQEHDDDEGQEEGDDDEEDNDNDDEQGNENNEKLYHEDSAEDNDDDDNEDDNLNLKSRENEDDEEPIVKRYRRDVYSDNNDDDDVDDDDDEEENALNNDDKDERDEADEDEEEHEEPEEDTSVEVEHIEKEVTDDDVLSNEVPSKAYDDDDDDSQEVSKEAAPVDVDEDDDVEFLEPDELDELPEVLPIPVPKGKPLAEVEESKSTEKPHDTLAEEEEYEKQQEALRKEKEQSSQGLWLKLTVGGALLVATHAVLRRATASRDSESEETDRSREETPTDRRMTLIPEPPSPTPVAPKLPQVTRPIEKEVLKQEQVVAKPPPQKEELEEEEEDEEVVIIKPSQTVKDMIDKERYSDEEEFEEEEEENVVEEEIPPPKPAPVLRQPIPPPTPAKPPSPAAAAKEPSPEPEEDDDVEIIDDEQIEEEFEEEEDDISEVDDAELLNRLEAKYGRLPEPERPGRKDGGNSIEDMWPGEPSDPYWRDQLDQAEQELRQGEWSSAEKRASAPELQTSARARYILARALDSAAEAKRDNRLLSRAIAAYLDLLKMNERLSDKKLLEVTNRTLERIKFRGTYLSAEPVYKLLIRRFPNDVHYRNNLTVSFLMANRADLAENALKETLKLWPDDKVALAHYGFVLKTLHNKLEEAVDVFTKALEGDTGPACEPRFYYHLGDALLLLGRFAEAHEVHKRGAANGHFLSPSQRSLYNVDRLKSKPWWNVADTPYFKLAKALEKSWKEILKEGEAAKKLYEKEKEGLKERGEWSQLDLFVRGREVPNRCSRAPVTCNIVRGEIAASGCRRGQIKFSAMEAGTHVRPHVGPTNCRLRMHLGLSNTKDTYIRVDQETRQWQTGKVLMFDDSFEHEVWHNGTGTRLVLIVDVWHPDLTPAERRQLPAI